MLWPAFHPSSRSRPLARRVNQRQYPHRFARDFVHQTIALVGNQLAGSLNRSRPAQLRMRDQPGGGIAEKFVHAGSGSRVIGRYVVPNVNAILQGLRRPNKPHAWLATLARRAANRASTSSLV